MEKQKTKKEVSIEFKKDLHNVLLEKIKNQMMGNAAETEKNYQKRIAEQKIEKEKNDQENFRKAMERLGYVIPSGIKEINFFESFILTVDCRGRIVARKKCEKCGKEVVSYPIQSMENFSNVVENRNWNYHHCYVPEEKESKEVQTIEKLVFDKIAEILNLLDFERMQ